MAMIEQNPMIAGNPLAGGYGGLGGAGFAPFGLFGLIGLNSRNGLFGGGDGNSGTTVLEQNVSELRKDVQGVNTTVEALGNELQGALAMQNLSNAGEFRNLDNRLCASEKEALQSAFALSTQGYQNTQAVKDLVTAFQTQTNMQFCEISRQINADGDATRALINQNEVNNLRDQLNAERRGRDAREFEINVTQTNQQLQNQMQAQFQSQNSFLQNAFGVFGDQLNRANNSIVAVGSTLTGQSQTASQANTKVN